MSRIDGGAEQRGGGMLYVVSTPIGNLEDVTLRALAVLRGVSLVAAEDTRMTRRLFARHGIETPLVPYHARSGDRRERELVEHLDSGRDLALVTDAGTPLVSDPGAGLVAAWAARGGTIVPIPGASAVLAALVASGVQAPRWGFEGFLPRRGRERRERLARIAADERATVLFEAPGRTAETLADLGEACGADRAAAVCRELTKRHEEVLRGTLGELAERTAREGVRGEVVIVVAGGGTDRRGPAEDEAGLAGARAEVARLVAAGAARGAAARDVAARTGIPRRALYGEPGAERD